MLNLLTYDGRLNRLKYLFYVFFANAIALISAIIAKNTDNTLMIMAIVIFNLLIGAKYICATIQRLHDIERPGQHYLLLFIPIYNIYLNIVLLFKKGTDGANTFGDDPFSFEAKKV